MDMQLNSSTKTTYLPKNNIIYNNFKLAFQEKNQVFQNDYKFDKYITDLVWREYIPFSYVSQTE